MRQAHGRGLLIGLWAGTAAIALLLLHAHAGEAERPAAKLWDLHIKDKANPRILDDFEVIEGLTLFQAAGGLESRTAALASVAFFTGSQDIPASCSLTAKQLQKDAAEWAGRELTPDEGEKIGKLVEKIGQNFGRRPAMPYYGTFGLGKVALLQMTVKDAGTIEECLGKIARIHGWCAALEKSADCGFEKYKEAIDKRVPIILERKNEYHVCFGYLCTQGKDCLVLADPKGVPLIMAPPPIHPEDREAAKNGGQFSQAFVKWAAENKVPWDLRTSVALPLLEGLDIDPFEKGRYTAYFIYGWHVSSEAWRKEIEEITGPPKGNK